MVRALAWLHLGVLLLGAAPVSRDVVPMDLTHFLASGYRAHQYQRTEMFVHSYAGSVELAHVAVRRKERFQSFLQILVTGLRNAWRVAYDADEHLVASLGNPGRRALFFDFSEIPSQAALHRAFAEVVEQSEASWGQGATNDEPMRIWERSGRIGSRLFKGVTIRVLYPKKHAPTAKEATNVSIWYPTIAAADRRLLDRHFLRLYRRAISDRTPHLRALAAAYELAWWILVTVYFENGSTSIAKGIVAALTMESFAVAGTGDDIDLVAMRSTPETFRQALITRFGAPCDSCACFFVPR